jgi:large subunit ribosomal protein L10
MFSGPTAITYSSDSIVPAKITVEYEKKYKSLKILGGFFEGKKIDKEKVKFLASLPLLDEIRGKLIGVLLAPAQKIALVIKEPSGQLARLLNKRSQDLEKTN